MEFYLIVEIGFLTISIFLYWWLLFYLIDQILEKSKFNNRYRVLIDVVNILLLFAVSSVLKAPNISFAVMFALMLVEFHVLYKCTFVQNLFCALACIIHVLILCTMIFGIFSIVLGSSVYEMSRITFLHIALFSVLFAFLDLAIILVLKLLPLDQIRIINQYKEPRRFVIAWMLINCLYLAYNIDVFYKPKISAYLTRNQVTVPLVITFGLYIVTLFAIRMVMLLGYKEKSTELAQAMVQAQQYHNSITKNAVISYEVNVTQNTIIHGFEDIRMKLGDMADNYSDILTFISNNIIYSGDINTFSLYASPDSLLHEYEHGKSEITAQYRRRTDDGEYIWVQSITNLLKNIETEDIIAYVYVKDIDKEKKRQLKLQYMAERDLLTGLYNKEITGKLVKEHLSDTQDSIESALFMIDVDDFKNINDHFGHVYGDAVLCEFGEKLGRAFRCDDIVGRIGGDEFIAYIKSGASEKIVREKVEEILKAVLITYKDSQGVEYSISSSIGVAMVPKDGRSFEEIYQHADTALYMAKCGGKDRYQLYDGSTFIGYESGRKETQTDETVSPKTFRQNRIEYVFKILYQSENPVEAIHAVLELIAGHFSFERGYIFETSKDGKTTSNTFEWCAIGITPERNNLQNVSIDVVSTANSSFYKTGTYIVKSLDDLNAVERTILKPQGIKSMFQFGIFDKRKLLGFIGFDNCINQALPNNTDIDEIKTICNILATFFVKQHNDEIAAQDLQVRQSVMNHLKNLVYVVNPQTFEVLFMNDQARKLVGVVKYDSPCYQLFRGKTKQCDDCPIKSLNDSPAYQMYCEIYNDKFKVWAEATASTLPWTDGSQAYLIESADITKQKEEHLRHIEQLEKLAFVDELTGCRTYYKFKEDAQGILMRQQDMSHVLIKFDIDNFRLINQIYGYEKGDEVLRNVVKAMERIMRDKDEIFARVSNDEFVALLSMRDNTTIETLHEHFLSNFNDLMEDDFSFKCTFPHGLCTVEPGEIAKIDIKDLFEKANFAHKMAKQNKDDQFVVYDESMTKKALCMKEIENKMSEALQNNEFEIYLQPKYYLDTELVGGAEALSRWRNENPELFFPNVFIPVFEKNGFITKLDFYVLRKTCTVIKNWLAMGIKPVTVSVNFSRLHLNNCNFVKELCEVVDSIEIDRKYIEVEITETAIYENMDALEALLIELHANGFAMSMDDFGSGYSSLGLLKNLPVDTIKMDRSFFANQKDTVRSKIVVGSIIEMAAGLGIHIVAEGVEEQQYIDLLRGLHCDMVQGYYYSRPMSVEDFTELIRKPVEFSSARSSYFA